LEALNDGLLILRRPESLREAQANLAEDLIHKNH
jgi:hypothetical protein